MLLISMKAPLQKKAKEISEALNVSYWRGLVEHEYLCTSTPNVFEKTAVNSYTVYVRRMSYSQELQPLQIQFWI